MARIVPIVEGHGEVVAIRTLLERTWCDVVHGGHVDVLTPIRRPRTKLVRSATRGGPGQPDAHEIARAVRLAAVKLTEKTESVVPRLILVLLDADEDCPKDLAPALEDAARVAAGPQRIAVVLANKEYETWFVAAAPSLVKYLNLSEPVPANPEAQRCGKAWISQRFNAPSYSETVDQVRLTAAMDLGMCRERSPSFDKLCRVLEALAANAACEPDQPGA